MSTEAERLHLLYEVNRRLSTLTDLDELLRYATRRARELFDAEGCALLLLDRERDEFYFPVASQSEGRPGTADALQDVRFPADRGVAGWVLRNDRPVAIPDAAADPRVFKGVDEKTHMTTRSLLCAPLHTPSGNIGVLELVNPPPASCAESDLEFLAALADDIGVACERAELYARLRGEVLGLRRALAAAGGCLLALGGLCVAGALLAQVAHAVPLREIPTRPGFLLGVPAAVVGALLIAGSRREWGRERRPAAAEG